jgi:hypothetical protein
LFYFYPEWIPLEEKTILLALVSSGVCIGEMISFSVSGYLAENRLMWGDLNVGGWASSFVWFGIVGVLWYPLFISFVYSSPLDHPTISKAELAIIYRGEWTDPIMLGLNDTTHTNTYMGMYCMRYVVYTLYVYVRQGRI